MACVSCLSIVYYLTLLTFVNKPPSRVAPSFSTPPLLPPVKVPRRVFSLARSCPPNPRLEVLRRFPTGTALPLVSVW